MKLEIRVTVEPIDVLGLFDVKTTEPKREVYLDDRRAPRLIEEAILEKLDRETEDYLWAISRDIETSGWRFDKSYRDDNGDLR